MSMAFFLVLGQFKGRLGQSWDKRDGGFCPKSWSLPGSFAFCPRGNRRPSVIRGLRRAGIYTPIWLREIVIDPVRCPKTYEEFTLKEYLRNPDGTWEDEIPDGRTIQ